MPASSAIQKEMKSSRAMDWILRRPLPERDSERMLGLTLGRTRGHGLPAFAWLFAGSLARIPTEVM